MVSSLHVSRGDGALLFRLREHPGALLARTRRHRGKPAQKSSAGSRGRFSVLFDLEAAARDPPESTLHGDFYCDRVYRVPENNYRDDPMVRIMQIAKEEGIKFALGTDAHSVASLHDISKAEGICNAIGITDEDWMDLVK